MKISAQEEYGVRCLLRLARNGPRESWTIPEIAEAEGLSPAYAAKLLRILRLAGFIEACRGRTGGYHLARPAAEIRLSDVLLALGEPMYDPGYCDRHAGPETHGPCVHQNGCTLRGLWQTLEQFVRHVLDQVTLEDLLHDDVSAVRQLRSLLPGPLLTLSPLSRE